MKWSPSFQMAMKWFPSFKMGCKNVSIFSMGYEMVYENVPWLRKWLLAAKSPLGFKMATKMLQASKWAAKLPFGCEMILQPHSYPLWNPLFAVKMAFWLWNDFPNFKMVVKWFPNFEMGCKNVFLFSLWLQDDLQATKWPPSYKNDLQNEERFAKTLYKAKESCINANKAPHHASKEESPLTEITHMKSLIPFLTSLNHQSP